VLPAAFGADGKGSQMYKVDDGHAMREPRFTMLYYSTCR
jgi:hypothetical protein